MKTKELLNRLEVISAEITALYAELAGELPDLRIVVDNTRNYSEVKKMPRRKLYNSRTLTMRLKLCMPTTRKESKVCKNLNTARAVSVCAR